MKSGMTAAEAVENTLEPMDLSPVLKLTTIRLGWRKHGCGMSYIKSEIFGQGLGRSYLGLINAGIELFRAKPPGRSEITTITKLYS